MKKKSLFAIFGGGLSLAMAAVAIGGFAGIRHAEEVGAVTAGTYTYDLVTNFSTYASSWSSSYASHTIASTDLGTNLPAASISFTKTNKQGTGMAITTMPVSKDSADSFTLSESGFVITSVEVVVSQWTTKIPTIYVKEAGASSNNYSGAAGLTASGSTGTEGTTGVISFAGTSVTSFTFGNTVTNQIGWKSIKITIAAAASFGTLKSISVLSPTSKLAFEVGDTFASTGLSLTATDTASVTKTVTSGFTTDYDAHVFVATDVGSKTVTISYTEGSVTATATYAITVSAAPVYSNDFTVAANCFSDAYKVAGNVTAGEYNGYKALNGLGWDFDASFGTSTTVAVQSNTGWVVGINTTPCESFTLTSDIFGVNDNYAISKIVINIKANSSLVATLGCKVGGTSFGTQNQTVPASATTDIVFSSATLSYGDISFAFAATTAKGLVINNIRVYAEAGSGDTHDAYVFAKKVEAADGCVANATLVSEYNGLSTAVKTIADAITFNDYATAAIKTATIPYKSLNVSVATKIAAISAIGGGAGSVLALNDSTAMIAVAVVSVLGLLTLAGVVVLKKKHN
jgi:hypothetical protein